jgi:hypothetical protein
MSDKRWKIVREEHLQDVQMYGYRRYEKSARNLMATPLFLRRASWKYTKKRKEQRSKDESK